MANNQDENDKPRVRPPSVAAAYLLEKVRKMEKEEAGVVEAARIKHRARIAGLVAKAPAEGPEALFRAGGCGEGGGVSDYREKREQRPTMRDIHEFADDAAHRLVRELDDLPSTVEDIGGGVARFISRIFGEDC